MLRPQIARSEQAMDAVFEGHWEWTLDWPNGGQRFLVMLLPGGGLVQCCQRLDVGTGLGRWEPRDERRCAWEFYALVAAEDLPNTGGQWHAWGDLVLSSRQFAGSQSTQIEIHNAQGNLLIRKERLAISARRLSFDQMLSPLIS